MTVAVSNNNIDLFYRVLVLGNERCGKSAFVERLNRDAFRSEYIGTIGLDVASQVLQSGEFWVNLQLFDCAGSAKFRRLLTSYVKQSHGVILLFDATDRASFAALPAWLDFVRAATPAATKRAAARTTLLVATKCDSTQRVVDDAEVRAFACAHGCTYAEFDARTCTQRDALVLVESLVSRLISDDTDAGRQQRAAAEEKAAADKRPAFLKVLDATFAQWKAKWICGL
jgi:small GTP-binding protein